MAGKQAESVIKNIIKEITIESSRKGQNVSETLAAFMVRFKNCRWHAAHTRNGVMLPKAPPLVSRATR